jgi:hypothetical protein
MITQGHRVQPFESKNLLTIKVLDFLVPESCADRTPRADFPVDSFVLLNVVIRRLDGCLNRLTIGRTYLFRVCLAEKL